MWARETKLAFDDPKRMLDFRGKSEVVRQKSLRAKFGDGQMSRTSDRNL